MNIKLRETIEILKYRNGNSTIIDEIKDQLGGTKPDCIITGN